MRCARRLLAPYRSCSEFMPPILCQVGRRRASLLKVQCLADKISRVLGTKLSHEMGAMGLKRPGTDSQAMSAFLVGSPSGDQCEHFMLARRQQIPIGTGMSRRCRDVGPGLPSPCPRVDRLAAITRDGGVCVGRLLTGAANPSDDIADALGFE